MFEGRFVRKEQEAKKCCRVPEADERKRKGKEIICRCERKRSSVESEPVLERRTSKRRDEKPEARAEGLRCLTVGESTSGEGTPRSKRRGGPKRYEPRRKPRGTESANRESRGSPEMGKSTRRAKSEPRSGGGRESAGNRVGTRAGSESGRLRC